MFKRSLIIGLAVLMVVGLSTIALADTEIHVEYETPNPDIHLSVEADHQANAWADISGSGDAATGEIGAGSQQDWAAAYAWQTADFEGGDYTAKVGAERLEEEGNSGHRRTSHLFKAEGSSSAHTDQGAAVFNSLDKTRGWGCQHYSATAAQVRVESLAYYSMNGEEPIVQGTYTGTAQGDVEGSQRTYLVAGVDTGNIVDVGLAANITGTEGTTTFEFKTKHISNIDVVSHESPEESTVSGKARTWEQEEVPLDEGFQWIESSGEEPSSK